MAYLMEKINCFETIVERLREEPSGHIWSNGSEILCQTNDVADAIADLLECMYEAHGEEIVIKTGYYDPIEDKRNGETDRYTGWWYVSID